MDDPRFFAAIAIGYVTTCVTFCVCRWIVGSRWEGEAIPETDRKWLDLAMVFIGAVGVLTVGELYRRGLLLPELPGKWSKLSTGANLIIPYAPLFIIAFARRQSCTTLMLSKKNMIHKFWIGCAAAIMGLIAYLVVAGKVTSGPSVLARSMTAHSLMHAPAVFMEGVALAFVYERLRWVMGHVPSILLPGLLFAAAHVPRSIESGRSPGEIAMWFAFNTVLPAGILHVVTKSRDVIWIAIPHYILDVAIGAFE